MTSSLRSDPDGPADPGPDGEPDVLALLGAAYPASATTLEAGPVLDLRGADEPDTADESTSGEAEAGDAAAAGTPLAGREARFGHLRSLDGLRGLAVVLVVLSHFAPGLAPGGFLGVDLFFVLSGFLITSLLVSEFEATTHISLKNFWIRRARRLFPALLVLVTVVLAYGLLMSTRAQVHAVSLDGMAALFYVANWRFIISGQSYIQQFLDQAPSPLRHTWSLAIEEQFYLVWPLLVLGLTRVLGARGRPGSDRPRRLRHALAICCVVLGSLSLGWMVLLHSRGANLDRIYYGTDTRVFMILAGATLGALTAGRPALGPAWSRFRVPLLVAGAAGLVTLLVLSVWVTTQTSALYFGAYGALALVMVTVLWAAGQPAPNPLARALEIKPLIGLGLISYGVYLWHWPIALWVRADNTPFDGPALFIARSALTLGISLVSYYVVERPIRRGWLPSVRGVGAKFVTPAIVVLAVICLLIPIVHFPSVQAAPKDDAPPTEGAFQATTAYSRAPRCDGPAGTQDVRSDRRLLVQLEGNSLAGEVTDCLRSILDTRGVDVERVDPPGFLICRDLPAIEDQASNPDTKPDAAILMLFVAYDDRCGSPWHATIDKLMAFYKEQGIHLYLVPSVPIVPGGRDDLAPGPMLEDQYYRQVAAADPQNVTFLDAGVFLRDETGAYRWTMPCLPDGEPGCQPDGNVGVRFVDGLHYCTDPDFAAHGCVGDEHQAGERRAAAAMASGLIPSLQSMFGSGAAPGGDTSSTAGGG